MFFFNDTATTEIYTLSLHDALPIWAASHPGWHAGQRGRAPPAVPAPSASGPGSPPPSAPGRPGRAGKPAGHAWQISCQGEAAIIPRNLSDDTLSITDDELWFRLGQP